MYLLYNLALATGTCYLIIEHNWSMWTWVITLMMMVVKVDTNSPADKK